MACFMRQHASLLLISLFLACSLIQTRARESEFFSKVSRPQKPAGEGTTELPEESPALDEVDPRTLTPQSHNGYGLYGRDSERLTTSSAPGGTTSGAIGGYGAYHYNAAEHRGSTVDDDREYRPSRAVGGAGPGPRVNYNPAATLRTNEWKNSRQQYGMSDTRFMANGRYFYDVNDEREHNGGAYEVNSNQGHDQYDGFSSRGGGYGGDQGYGGRSGINGYEKKDEEYESNHGYDKEDFNNAP